MIRINLQSLLRELGVDADIEHTDVSSLGSCDIHLIVGAKQIIDSLPKNDNLEMLALDNIVDKTHLRERFIASCFYDNWREK
ncbi:PTS ascorbate transporter subunit IIB [Paenibacillus marchantiophytorum]